MKDPCILIDALIAIRGICTHPNINRDFNAIYKIAQDALTTCYAQAQEPALTAEDVSHLTAAERAYGEEEALATSGEYIPCAPPIAPPSIEELVRVFWMGARKDTPPPSGFWQSLTGPESAEGIAAILERLQQGGVG